MVDVPPGKNTVISKAENDATLVVEAEAGGNYYVWQEIKMGWLFARSHLQLVDESKGKSCVNECFLIDSKVKF